jgi:hypothetical protein
MNSVNEADVIAVFQGADNLFFSVRMVIGIGSLGMRMLTV